MENIHADQHLIVDITRDQFEELAEAPVFSKLLEPVDRALEDCEAEAAEIDAVLLVGGSTRIPWVHRYLQERFGRAPNTRLNADEGVAYGATVLAGQIRNSPGDG